MDDMREGRRKRRRKGTGKRMEQPKKRGKNSMAKNLNIMIICDDQIYIRI
jgi:hypothetical protein